MLDKPAKAINPFRLYIDESGDHTFNRVDEDAHRYLAVLGVWFRQGKPYLDFVRELQELKDRIFGPRPDDPVIFHREDIVNRRGPFWRLNQPEIAKEFGDGILKLVSEGRFRVCCIVIDKQTHQEKTYRSLFHPYHYCLAALLDRYVGLLARSAYRGDVLAESRGGAEDRQLKEAFKRFYHAGTRFHPPDKLQRVLTSREIKLKKKTHCIAGLELADILANPVRRGVICEHSDLPLPEDFGTDLYQAVAPKFNRHLFDGRVWGYGKVWLD